MNITKAELELLKHRIETCAASAQSAHGDRIARFREYMRQWHNRVKAPAAGEEQDSNFSVPYTQAAMLAKWSKFLQGLFGDDAEIIAEPSGPTDVKTARRVGKFVTIAFLRIMPDAAVSLATYAFNILFNGRGHCYREWIRNQDASGNVFYEGPRIWPLKPENVVVPAEEDVTCVQDFSWSHRLYWISPDELLNRAGVGEDSEPDSAAFNFAGYSKAERDGKIREIIRSAQNNGGQRPGMGSVNESMEIADEVSYSEGVQRDMIGDQGSEFIRVWECYHYWRPLKKGEDSAPESDIDKRELRRERVVIQYVPMTQDIISVRPVSEVFPNMSDAVPIDDGAVTCDGRYWTIGLGQQAFDIQEEQSAIHNGFTNALDLSQNPHIFYEPTSGFDPKSFRYGPKGATPVASTKGIQVVNVQADVAGAVSMLRLLDGYGEKALGISDATAGRSSDRPNAPRTLGGQMLLAELGDVRAWIDTFFLREALSRLMRNLWEMYVSFGSGDVFFRITEEEAAGLFDVKDGGAVMTSQEFAGRYDFKIKFATSAVSKQSRKVEAFEKFKAAMSLPIVIQNPRAQWVLLNDLFKAMGDDSFSNVLPEPADLDQPIAPKVEHAKMQEGELVTTHPQDNDQLHLSEHNRMLARGHQSKEIDRDFIRRLGEHMAEHTMQLNKKTLMHSLVMQIAGSMGQDGGVPGLPGVTGHQPGGMMAPGGPGADAGQLMQAMSGGQNGTETDRAGPVPGGPGQSPGGGATSSPSDFGLHGNAGAHQGPRF